MKLISVGDVHMSDVAPVGRQDDYAVSIMSKLIEIVELAKVLGAVVVFVGDIFHRRRFNDYKLIAAMIRLLREVPCYSIYGNHDWDPRTQDIKSQPINVLFSSGALKRLTADGEILYQEGQEWIEIKGLDYTRDVALDKIKNLKWSIRPRHKVLVLHAMIVPTGTTFYGESVTVDQVQTEADLILIGHPHWDQGVIEHGRQRFVNFGATARLYRSEANRTVQVGIYDFAPNSFTIDKYPLKCVKSIEEVFIREVEVLKEGKKVMLVESIVQAVNSQQAFDINSMNIPTELKDTVDHYLLLAKQEKG